MPETKPRPAVVFQDQRDINLLGAVFGIVASVTRPDVLPSIIATVSILDPEAASHIKAGVGLIAAGGTDGEPSQEKLLSSFRRLHELSQIISSAMEEI